MQSQIGYSRAVFILVLSAGYFTGCNPRPNNVRTLDDAVLFQRDVNESAGILSFQYSPSWFNTKSQASLWQSALKVNARTRALLFSPGSTLLEDTLESNNASRLGNFLDQVFANNLASDDVRTQRTRRATDLEDPPDPIGFQEDRWAMNFSGYGLDGDRVSAFVCTSIALMSYAQVGTDMIVNLLTPLSNYRYAGYRQDLYPPESQRTLSYILESERQFLYEDVLMSLKLFISWTATWSPDHERRVPSTSMVLKKTYPEMAETEIASGRLVIRGAV